MVHHFLKNFDHGESNLLLYTDNYVGQNKNETMIEYLALFDIIIFLHQSINILNTIGIKNVY